MMKASVLILLFICSFFLACSEKSNPNLDKANGHFQKKEYDLAIAYYQKIVDVDSQDSLFAGQRLEESLFLAAKRYFDSRLFAKSVEYLNRLILQFPESAYYKRSKELLAQSHYEIGVQHFNQKDYHRSLRSFEILNSDFVLSLKQKESVNQYFAESLYRIGLSHYETSKFYFARVIWARLLKESHHKETLEKLGSKLEEAYFKDAEKQFTEKAYRNSREVFSELIAQYPNSPFSAQAKGYLSRIESLLDSSEDREMDQFARKNELDEKGNEQSNPYGNEDLKFLLSFLDEERKKNPEKLKSEIFPVYEEKFVYLTEIKIAKYEKVKKIQVIDDKSMKFIDGYLGVDGPSQEHFNYDYIIESNSISKLQIFVKKQDFMKLDFSKEGSLTVEGKIYHFNLEDGVQIQILSDKLEQKQSG